MHKELRQAVARSDREMPTGGKFSSVDLRYKTFLELVRDSSEEFSEIQDILARWVLGTDCSGC